MTTDYHFLTSQPILGSELFANWVVLNAFLSSADFLQKLTLSKNSLRNTIRVSNSLDPDQTQHFVEPDLGANCLQGYQQTTLVGKELWNQIV